MQRVDSLRYIVSKYGIDLYLEGVKSIQNWRRPKNRKDLQKYLSIIGAYKHFIENYSKTVNTHYWLLKDEVALKCENYHEISFFNIKDKFKRIPKFSFPDDSSNLILQTDASGIVLGAILLIMKNINDYAVSLTERKLKEVEIKK